MKQIIVYAFTGILLISLNSCFSTRKVQRVDPDKQVDLSGRWNDTDSKLTAEELTRQVLNEPWLSNYKEKHGKKPILIVGLVKNKSHEHIDVETFIKDIERSIIQNGSARLVQAGDKREELRRERADQQEFASAKTAKEWGKELGADFIMQGSLNSIVDKFGREKVVTYQINLELTNLETNEIVWIGDKKIKKQITD